MSFSPLQYWKFDEHRFPALAPIARDVMGVKASSAKGLFINYVVAFLVFLDPLPPYCDKLSKIEYPLPPNYVVNAKTPPKKHIQKSRL